MIVAMGLVGRPCAKWQRGISGGGEATDEGEGRQEEMTRLRPLADPVLNVVEGFITVVHHDIGYENQSYALAGSWRTGMGSDFCSLRKNHGPSPAPQGGGLQPHTLQRLV